MARTIGVCTNRLDDPSVVGDVCLAIRRGYPDAVIELRPHPADKRVEAWRAVALTAGVRFSSATEPSVRFLERVGVVVADGSSILLEAALAGARPINFSFGGSTHDPYGFVLRGVAVKAGDVHELVSVLGSDVSDNGARRRALRFYDASIDSTHEGHATEVAAAAIRRIAGRENAVPATWIRADCQRLEAYSAPAIGDRVSADGSPA